MNSTELESFYDANNGFDWEAVTGPREVGQWVVEYVAGDREFKRIELRAPCKEAAIYAAHKRDAELPALDRGYHTVRQLAWEDWAN